MSDQPPLIYPNANGSMGTLVYIERKCCDCAMRDVAWTMDGLRCADCAMEYRDREQGNHWANHVLRRCEEDAEFRERLRKALGVEP